jgi:mono/diheme cytochrome c family protein
MDKQQRFNTQANNPMYKDGRAMRPQVEGTVAREDLSLPNEVLTVSFGEARMVGGTHEKVTFANASEYAEIMHGRIRGTNISDEAYKTQAPPKDEKELALNNFYVTDFPAKIIRAGTPGGNEQFTRDFIERGHERFNIYCTPCHGASGFGDGMVQRRATEIVIERNDPAKGISGADYVSLWTKPADLTKTSIRNQPVGKIFNTITNGQAGMPAYDKQISVQDRWAIVMYVRALQLSQQHVEETKTAAADNK